MFTGVNIYHYYICKKNVLYSWLQFQLLYEVSVEYKSWKGLV